MKKEAVVEAYVSIKVNLLTNKYNLSCFDKDKLFFFQKYFPSQNRIFDFGHKLEFKLT